MNLLTGETMMSTRWVLFWEVDSGIIPKARLVPQGFEEDILFQSDSPTCGNESLRIVMAIIIAQKLRVVYQLNGY